MTSQNRTIWKRKGLTPLSKAHDKKEIILVFLVMSSIFFLLLFFSFSHQGNLTFVFSKTSTTLTGAAIGAPLVEIFPDNLVGKPFQPNDEPINQTGSDPQSEPQQPTQPGSSQEVTLPAEEPSPSELPILEEFPIPLGASPQEEQVLSPSSTKDSKTTPPSLSTQSVDSGQVTAQADCSVWPCSCGDVITGSVVFGGNLTCNDFYAFTVTTSNIVIDGNGYYLIGTEVGNGTGILVNNSQNVTIKNFAGLDNFSRGISLGNTSDSYFINNNITVINNSVGNAAIYLIINSHRNLIANNTLVASENSKGVHLVETNLNNTILNNNITADAPLSGGILLANSNNNNTNISNNIITIFFDPSAMDIQSPYTYIYNNTLVSNGVSSLINLENGGSSTIIKDNNLTLNVGGTNYIDSATHAILSQTSSNNVSGNTITTSDQYAQGITIFNGMQTMIINNNFFISGQDSFAVGLIDGASNNTLKSNNITVSGSGASHAIYEDFIGLDGPLGLNFLENNNLSSLLNYTIYDGESANTSFIYNNSYGFFNVTKGNITSSVSLVIGKNVLLSYNNVSLLSDVQNLELNSSAQLELKSLEWINVSELLLDGTRCDNTDLCNTSYNYRSGILSADVSYLGNFSTTSNNNQPSVDSIYLNSSDFPDNLTSANLTLNLSVSDTDNNPVKNITNWIVDGNSWTLLYLPFEGINKTTTGNAWDYSGFGHHGSITSANWNATGGYDGKGAYEFTNLPNGISLNLTSNNSDFTVSFFARYSNYSQGNVFSVGDRNGFSLGFSSAGEPYFSAQNLSFANWTKYNNSIPPNSNTTSYHGQIPPGLTGSGDSSTINHPDVIKDGNTYKMWYSGYPYIFYATSPDGLTWTKYNNSAPVDSDDISYNGQIPQGTSTKGDSQITQGSAVIKDGETYKMWYSGNNASGIIHIYYATSPDGLTWTKYNNTIPPNSDDLSYNGQIPSGNPDQGDDNYVDSPSVLKDGDTYKMWYAGNDGLGSSRIYYATSPDGLTWTKYNNTLPTNSDDVSYHGQIPLGTNSLKGDYKSVLYPEVIKDGDGYKMWYTGYDNNNYRIFYAVSPDGLTWTKHNNSVPINSNNASYHGQIPLGSDGQGDDARAGSASIVKDGNIYKMWYTGYDGVGGLRIYHATLDSGLNSSSQAEDDWTQITLSQQGNLSNLYVNGQQQGSSNFSAINLNGTIHLGDYFNGSIDEIYIYNRSLSPEQISTLYDNETNLIVNNETDDGEVWSACVTPNDGFEDGVKTCSNNITIISSIVDPTVTLNYPINNYWNNTANITFNCSASSQSLANITLWTDTNGIWQANQTKTLLGLSNSTEFNLTDLNDNNTGYLWNCLAYDLSGGASFSIANRTFYIDTISPISNITISPTTIEYNLTNVSIDWNAFDLNESYVNANVTYPNGSLLAQSSDGTINFSLNTTNLTVLGTYRVIVWINDSAGNFNYSNETFTVVDTAAPIVTLNYPADNYWNNTGNVTFNCSATNTNLSNITLWTDVNGSWSANQTKSLLGADNSTEFNLTDLIDNNTGYLWNCLAYDSSGNSNFSIANRTFYIDTISPISNITISPTTIEYNLTNISIDWNAFDLNESYVNANVTYPNGSLLAQSSDGTINFSLNTTNLTVLGTYRVIVWINDSAGNFNYSNETFTVVDTAAPIVTLNYPADNYWNNTGNVTFNCSATNTNLSNITLWTDVNGSWSANQTKTLLGSSNSTEFNLTDLNDNNTGYLWNCLAYDSSGNSNFSIANRTFYIDTTLPNVNLISPTVDYVNDSLSLLDVNFTCNASDSNQLSNLSIYLTNSANQSFVLNRTSYINGTSNESNWTIPLRSGNYTWDCYACDTADNCNFSAANRTIKLNATVAQLGVPLIGSITLVENLTDLGDGLIVGSNNTIIDGAGFSVVSNGSGSGINVSGYSNVIIQNIGSLNNFSVGIDLNNSQNVTISNITIVSANLSGVVGVTLGFGSNSNNLSDLNVSVYGNNSIGLSLNNSANNTFTSLEVSSASGPELVLANDSLNNSFVGVVLQDGPNFTTDLIHSLSVNVNNTPPDDPSSKTSLSYYLTLDNLSSDSHIDFNLSYLDSDLTDLTENTVAVYHYNDVTGTWSLLSGSSVDTVNNVVSSGFVDSFSTFGVFGDTTTTDSGTVDTGGGGGSSSTIGYPPAEAEPLRPEVPIASPATTPAVEEAVPEFPPSVAEESPLEKFIKSEALVAQAIASDALQLVKGLSSLIWIILFILVIGMLLLLIHLKRKGHSVIVFRETAPKKLLNRQSMSSPERLASEMREIDTKLNYLNQSIGSKKEIANLDCSSTENRELTRIEEELAKLR